MIFVMNTMGLYFVVVGSTCTDTLELNTLLVHYSDQLTGDILNSKVNISIIQCATEKLVKT